MKLPRCLSLAVLCVVVAPLCQAGVYVKAAGLYNRPGDIHINNTGAFRASLKRNIGLSAALGYQLSQFRVEAELQRLTSDTEPSESSGTLFGGIGATTGAIKETAGFANGYFDFPAFFGFAPYVGAGLGYARVDLDNLGRTRNGTPALQFSGSDSVFGYQAMLGFQFHLFGTATLNGGYRFIKRQNIAVREVGAAAQQNLKLGDNRVFELGLAIGF